MKFKIFTFLIFQFFFCTLAFSQARIAGKIVDEEGTPLIGATVLVEGTLKGTATNFDGEFELENVPEGSQILTISYTGYQSQTVPVQVPKSGTLSQDFTLKVDAQILDEIVVVGYGVQRKRDLSGSISKVDGQKLQATITPSFESALQGQAAGVSVIQGSGLAGASSVIRIRGISSISASAEPLYVVDGIPIDVNYFLAEANWQNGAFNNNPLASLNPADIESIEILKDASAAGIYGSRGTNGVILITTKRGKSKRLSIDFSTRVATSDPVAKPDLLNSQEWLALRQEAWELDGNTGTVWIPNYSSVTDSEATKRQAFEEASKVNTDWWDLLTQTGIKSEVNLGASFGTDFIKTYLGYTYGNSDSYIIGNNLKKHNIRANMDFDLGKKLLLKLSGSYNYGLNERVRVAYTGGLGDAMSTALPIYRVYKDDGTYWRGYNSTSAANPIFSNDNFEGFTLDQRSINTAQLVYTPIKKLNFVLNGGYDWFVQDNDQYENLDNTNQLIQRAERDSRTVKNYTASAFGEYSILESSVNKLKLMAGSEIQRKLTSGFNNLVYRGVESTQFRGKGNFSDEMRDNTNYTILQNDRESFISFFSRVNYALYDKYVFQVSARSDGSSKFGSNNRFGFFPAVSAGWIVSEEDFFRNGVVNYLKIKSSFGVLGNAGLPSNQWVGTIKTDGQYNGQKIRYVSKIPNPDLKWETTKTFDLGFESGWFNDRITLEMTYYYKNTEDALLNLTVPGYFGYGDKYWDNVAHIVNEGVEGSITAYPLKGKSFSWRTTLNTGYNYNEIVSIGSYTEDAVSGGTNDTRVVEGHPVGTNFLIPFYGVDPENGKPLYLDINGNPTYEYNETRDRRAVGDVLPDFSGGWDNAIQVGPVGLNFLFTFSSGFDVYDSSSKRQMSFLSDWNVWSRIGKRWKEPGDVVDYPKVTLNPAEHGNDKEWFNTDTWLLDGSFIRLRNIALSYNFPQTWMRRIGAQSGFISVGGTNLMTFTKYPGLDPEVVRDFDDVNDRNLSSNITYLTPPQEKSYMVSLNLKF